MTTAEIKEFYEGQVAWYKKEIEWNGSEIEFLTRELERGRKADRELAEYVWSSGVLTELEMRIWGDPKAMSSETRKIWNRRRVEYQRRKKNVAKLAEYEALVAEMN